MPEVLDPPRHSGSSDPSPEPQSPGVSNRIIWAVLAGCLVVWVIVLLRLLL